MEKIAIALQRILGTETEEENLFGPVHEALHPEASSPVCLPSRIEYTRTRIVEIAPHVLERHRVAAVANNATTDAFRLLRTQVLMQMRQNGWQTLAVTSPNKGAGKSTVSLNLAISFAMEVDYTALLVDADLRDPDVRNMLELEPGPGLADYLVGKAAIEDLLIHPLVGNLVVLPGGKPVANTSELMRSPMMAELVRELRGRYPDRLIVFDVPPSCPAPTRWRFPPILTRRSCWSRNARPRRDDIERSCDLLRHSDLMGIVLNKSRELPEPDPIRRPKPGFFARFFGAEG